VRSSREESPKGEEPSDLHQRGHVNRGGGGESAGARREKKSPFTRKCHPHLQEISPSIDREKKKAGGSFLSREKEEIPYILI